MIKENGLTKRIFFAQLEGIEQITGLEIDTDDLEESADQKKKQKKDIMNRLQKLRGKQSSEFYPREMYK